MEVRRDALLLVLLCLAVSAQAGIFRAGVAQVDITPPPGIEMWGYSSRSGPAQGTLDPLMARVLVLDDESSRIAVVTLDLGRTFAETLLDGMRDAVRRSYRVDQVFFIASHTHSGPVIEDGYPEGKVPAWETRAQERITAAIGDACNRLAPARIGTGVGEVFIGHNRRLLNPDGTVKMFWRNVTRVQTSPVDARVGVIRVDDAVGRAMTILVNYSCHPVVLGPDNLRYSADFPGAMAHMVSEKMEGNPICFFLQGAPGDINPFYDKTPLQEAAVKRMKQTGEQLGVEVCRVTEKIVTTAPENARLKFRLEKMQFSVRWDLEVLLQHLKRFSPAAAERYRRRLSKPLSLPVMTLLINDSISFMGMPGEPFISFAIDFRKRSPALESFFVGYANGYYAYFPPIAAAVTGGYGANTITTWTEVGAGETMVDHSIIALYEMLGMLKSSPSP